MVVVIVFLKDANVIFVTIRNMWELLCNQLDTNSANIFKKVYPLDQEA
jgi:hypothetical protein